MGCAGPVQEEKEAIHRPERVIYLAGGEGGKGDQFDRKTGAERGAVRIDNEPGGEESDRADRGGALDRPYRKRSPAVNRERGMIGERQLRRGKTCSERGSGAQVVSRKKDASREAVCQMNLSPRTKPARTTSSSRREKKKDLGFFLGHQARKGEVVRAPGKEKSSTIAGRVVGSRLNVKGDPYHWVEKRP